MSNTLIGCLFWGAVLAALYAVRPNGGLNSLTAETAGRREKIVLLVLAAAVVLLCTLPMSLSPYWNGEFPEHRNQYELMAEAILDGRLHLEYDDVDPKLLEMENPYDTMKRIELGVSVHWDHAFYNGRHYMYFGIVPVILLFLPFRLVTGVTLVTYQATQIFTGLFIAGMFALFRLVAKKFFPSLSWAAYLSLSAAFSMMSVWYLVGEPALYCTAIASGICMEVWSLYFFVKAVWDSPNDRRAVLWGVAGSLCGALAFGCRPPIALVNLLAVPMLLRAMTPGIIALDEVALEEDAAAVRSAVGCGVTLLATVHAASLRDLESRPIGRDLLSSGGFRRAVIIEGRDRQRRVERLP